MAWRRYLPKTMAGLLAAGYLAVALPLLLAVFIAQLSLHRLAEQSDRLLREGVALGQASQQLRNRLHDLERTGRQYAVSKDRSLGQLFEKELAETRRRATRLASMPRAGRIDQPLDGLREGLAVVERDWGHGTEEAVAAAIARLPVLADRAAELTGLGNAVLNQESEQLRRRVREGRRVIMVSLLFLLPLTLLMALATAALVVRPLQRARRSIESMGRGIYDEPTEIDYPREMSELGEHLDWLRQRLAELEQDQDRFLRNVSHELKTPLTSLIQGLDLLRNGKMGELNEHQLEVAEILGESSQELEHLIANLIAYSRWQSERQGTEMDWFEVQPLVEEVLAPRKLLLASHGLDVHLKLCTEPMYGDRARLKEALDNLVGNAIKHTRRGSAIEIWARVGKKLQILAVRDFGRGVPVKDQRRIFDPFIRGAEREEVGIRGTGIGLTIVRETAHAHAGRVEVQNAKPGARFILQWPLSVSVAP